MGLEVAALVLAGVSVAATAGKISAETKAANERTEALNLQAKEQKVEVQQKQLSNLDVLQKVLDAQEASVTTRGVSFSSPSLNAIQRDTLNIAAKKAKNLDIEEKVSERNNQIERQNVRDALSAQIFGDVAGLAEKGASAYGAAPKSLPKLED